MPYDTVSHILLDLDGVLVDFVGGICEYHRIENPYRHPGCEGKWEIDELAGMSKARFWEPCNWATFWKDLDWTEDGREILGRVERLVGAANVYLLTSPTVGAGAYSGKYGWVKENLPAYTRRLLIGPCKHLCAGPNRLLIDDYDKNVDEFILGGGQAILVPRPWNCRHAEERRVLRVLERELLEKLS